MLPLARLAAVLVALVVAGSALVAPAKGDTVVYSVDGRYLESVTVANTQGPLQLTARVDVDAAGDPEYLFYSWELDVDGDRAAEFLSYWSKGLRPRLYRTTDDGPQRVPCDRLDSVKLGDGASRRITVPRGCLRHGGRPTDAVRFKHRTTLVVTIDDERTCRSIEVPRKGWSDWVGKTGSEEAERVAVSPARQATSQRGC